MQAGKPSVEGGAPNGVGAEAGAGMAGGSGEGGASGEAGTSAAGEGGVGGTIDSGGAGAEEGGAGGAREPTEPCVLRVSPQGADTNDGSNWAGAFATLEGAMIAASARASSDAVCQVWLAEGTYAPKPWPADAAPGALHTLRVPDGVEIYGGFLGNEDSLAERNGSRARTIVTGMTKGTTARLGPVFTTEGSARIDQLTIRDGENAAQGGGVVCERGKLVLNEVVVTRNVAADGGGLFVAPECRAQVQSSIFSMNSAGRYDSTDAGRGGAIANFGGRLVVRGGTITTNSAAMRGGGVYTTGNTDISDTELAVNQLQNDVGPVSGGAVYAEGTDGAMTSLRGCVVRGSVLYSPIAYGAGVAGSGLVITSSQISGNSLSIGRELYGGGIYGYGSLTLDDSTVRNNSGRLGVSGGGLHFQLGELRVRRSIFNDNSSQNGAQLRCANGCRAQVSATFNGGTGSSSSEAAVAFDGASLDLINSVFLGNVFPLLRVDSPNGTARVIHSTFNAPYAPTRPTLEHLAGTLLVQSSVMASWFPPNATVVPVQILSLAPAALSLEKNDIVGLCGGASSCGSNWDVAPTYAGAPYPAGDSFVIDAGDAPLPPDTLDLDFDGNFTEPLPVDFDGNPRVAGARSDLGAIEYRP